MYRKRAALLLFITLPFLGWSQAYFQQEVNYEIDVTLDDEQHILHGYELIEYINNSPANLHYIWFHLWPNAYSNTKTALSKQMREDEDLTLFFSRYPDRGWIDSLEFRVNGKMARFEIDPKNPDICRLFLEEPVKPGEKIFISTPFRVKIPKGIFSRLGHLDQAYQITQWYPKPAVFDHKGWHQMPYLGQGEFYSEFGTYDVKITLPENYVVGATGDLVNGEKELAWLDQKVKETEAIREFDYNDLSFPPSSANTKTLHYHQEKVHDFGWFADKRYHVLKGEVELPISKRKVTTWAMFTNNEADLWQNSIEYLNDATYLYSLWVDEYPYNHVTAVDGVLSEGGGMEYPNVTIIGESGDAKTLEETIMHEVGHNWFYGILGSNERDHPWMDEGMNSFIEQRYMRRKYPTLTFGDVYGGGKFRNFLMKWLKVYNIPYKHLNQHAYLLSARAGSDQPIEARSTDYSSVNYGTIVYMKTAFAFNYLMHYLGEDKMNDLMLAYFTKWKFKHPYPEDFQKVAIEETGDSLKWFFEDVIRSEKKLDYSVAAIKKEEGKLKVKVRNAGRIAGPFPISLMQNNEVVSTEWITGTKKSVWLEFECENCNKVIIDHNEVIPDVNRKNNSMRINGVFRKVEPLQPRFLAYYENPSRSQFAYAPIGGWNNYDGFMLGAAVYNNLLPENKFEYTLMPMYAFKSKTVTGYGRLAYTFRQDSRYPEVRIAVEGQRFDVGQISPFFNNSDSRSPQIPNNILRQEVNFFFRSMKRRLNITHNLRIRNSMFFAENNGDVLRQIPQITYSFNQAFAPHISELNLDGQWLNGEAKLGIEAIYRFKFKRSYGIRARFFFGKMLMESSTAAFNFRMSSPRGYQEYLYDGAFLGRNETAGFLSQQMVEADGGFKSYTRIGASKDWILALNLSSTLYRNVPIELFMSVGTYSNAKSAFPGSETFLVEFGASVVLVRNVLEVHFPFLYSKNVKDDIKLNTNNYGQQIRFTFNVNQIKPRQLAHSFLN